MADAADEARPTKRQRLTAELEQSVAGCHTLETVSCSICTEVFEDPVSPRGSVHTYCRACIRRALAVRSRCPLSNVLIAVRRGNVDAVLDGNHQVRSMIDSQPVTCKYALHGCTEQPMLDSVDAHEANCPCRPAKCARCPFVGNRAATTAHEQVCPFVLLSPVLDAQNAWIRGLEDKVRRLKAAHEATERFQARRLTEEHGTTERLRSRLEALEAAQPLIRGLESEVRDVKLRLTEAHEATERLQVRLEALEAARPGELAVVSPARRASEDDVREARELCYEGAEHKCDGEWPEAIAAFQRSVNVNPNNPSAWYQLGCTYYEQNGNKSCEASFEPYTRCIALDPMTELAHMYLGDVLRNVRKDYDGAEKMYRKVIELDSTYVHAHYSLGLALNRQDKWPEAIAALRKCVELDPNNSMAWFELGYAYYNQNGRKSCEGSYEPWIRCVALDPTHARAYKGLGNILTSVREDYNGAEKMYRKAIELEPTIKCAHYSLGFVLTQQKEWPEAIAALRRCVELDPNNSEAWYKLGCAYYNQNGGESCEASSHTRAASRSTRRMWRRTAASATC